VGGHLKGLGVQGGVGCDLEMGRLLGRCEAENRIPIFPQRALFIMIDNLVEA